MDRLLVALDESELKAICSIADGGVLDVDTTALSRALGRSLGLLGVRVALETVDYLCDDEGRAVCGTETTSGIWWQPGENDTALVGSFILEGSSLAVMNDGEGPSPLVYDPAILERAVAALASEYEKAEVTAPDVFEFATSSGRRAAVVRVTRDHRLRRPQDLLSPEQFKKYSDGRLSLAIVHMIGGGKALVLKHGM